MNIAGSRGPNRSLHQSSYKRINKSKSKITKNEILIDYLNQKYKISKPWYIQKYQFLNNDFNKYIAKYYFKLIVNVFRLSFFRKSDFLLKEPRKKIEKNRNFFLKFNYDKYIIKITIKKKKLFKL